MYNQPNGLPVSAEEMMFQPVDVRQLPPPQCPSSQYFDPQMLYALHSELVNQVQSNATRSPLRVFMYNMAASNGYQNQYYQELLESVLQLTMAMGQQAQAPNVVTDVLLAEMSLLAGQYPAVGNYLTGQQHQELQALHQHRQQLGQLIRSAGQQPMQQQQQPMGHSPYGGNMGRPMSPSNSGFPHHQPRPNVGGRPSTVGGMGGQMRSNPGIGQPTGMRRQPQASPVHRGPSRSASSMIDSGQSSQPDFRKPGVSTVSAASRVTNQPIHEEEDMIVADPVNRELAHYSETDEQIKRFPKAIDRPTELRIYHYVPTATRQLKPVVRVVNDKTVYSLIDKEHSAMDYEAHELSYNLKKFHRDGIPSPRVMDAPKPKWDSVGHPSIVEESDTSETIVAIPDYEALSVHGYLKATDLQSGRLAIVSSLKKRGLTAKDRPIEGYIKLGKPYPAEQNDIYVIKELLEQPDLTSFVDVLIEAAAGDDISQGFYYAIHDRLTDTLNRRVRAGLGLQDWSVDSIARDYEDLMNELAKEIQTTTLDRFKRSTLNILKGVIEADISQANEGVITFEERISITQVHWTSEEMGLEFNDSYTQLTSAVDVNFLAAMINLLRRTSGKSQVQVNRRFLVTADNQWLEIHHSDIGADNVILSLV